jgi:hypothetical protein
VFEISVNDRLDELETLLLRLGAIEIDRTAISMFALFSKGTDQKALVTAVYENGFRVKNFRDLSNDIEALLLMPRFRAWRQRRAASHTTSREH